MFDKSALNNHITSHKNSVKKAKVSVINKLVRKCRKLEKLQKTPLKSKVNRKLERITSTIAAVKKLNCLQILKKAILFENDPNIVITNGNASVENLAEMLVFSNKIIREIVASLKVKFNLNNNNPNWKEYFQKERKKAKAKTVSISENLSTSMNDSKITKIREENTEKREVQHKVNNLFPENKIIKFHDNTKGTVNEKNLDEKFISKPDPFFTTKSGDNYISTVYLDDREVSEYKNVDNPFSNRKHSNDVKNKNFEGENHYQYKNSKNYNRNTAKPKTSFVQVSEKANKNKIIRFEEFEEPSTDKTKSDTPETCANAKNNSKHNLHPSWQAKQKIKPVIQEFKGQKLVFED
ncbi:probable serine/threonine-protein kinase clkA [Condylostylus longicornis]|uniref:probable serine/threonine-protein kinase clkA n=1 Tax=Condylostylus longicornis TaxID=2530218 RepID=UPI00244DEE14|nr:probable serine/threonine-protein kinase clkA [Condylostylus longicornis]